MKKIYIALSGGADSVALMHILNKLVKENPEGRDHSEYNLSAIHINHSIRKNEALRDEKFCKNLCAKYGINFISYKIDVPSFAKKYHLGIEEAARICRYNIFKNICMGDPIFLAHHLNDQAETIIQNIIRGSGIAGLAGMQKISYMDIVSSPYEEYFENKILDKNFEDKKLLVCRPLLDVSKEQILKYIKLNNLEYVDDTTNFDDNYTRNYIRLNIIPSFEKVNKRSIDHLYDLSTIAKDVEDDYNNWAKSEIEKISSISKNIVSIEVNDIKIYSDLKVYYLISHVLFNILEVNKKDWSKKHFSDILDLLKKDAGGHLDLPCNITLDKKSKILTFIKNDYNISMDKRKNK